MSSLLLIGKNGGGSSDANSANVDTVEIIGPECSIALGAFALPGIIAGFHALKTEDVEALGEDSILFAHVAAGAGQTGLVIFYLLHKDLVTIGHHVRFLGGFQFSSQP